MESQGNPDVLVPSPASARATRDGALPDAGKDCAARKEIKQGRSVHQPRGHIIPGDGIQGYCLGDPVGPETITSANGCEPREEWHLCRLKPWVDLFYDKSWRL